MSKMKKEIEKVNERFYEALNMSNMTLMEELWVKDFDVKCVHPGWPMLTGWEKIKESWKNIFEAGGLAQVEISGVFVDVNDNSAWVNCIERISYVIGDQVFVTLAQTTNIYELKDSKWYIVLHHASPMPVPMSELASDTLQ